MRRVVNLLLFAQFGGSTFFSSYILCVNSWCLIPCVESLGRGLVLADVLSWGLISWYEWSSCLKRERLFCRNLGLVAPRSCWVPLCLSSVHHGAPPFGTGSGIDTACLAWD